MLNVKIQYYSILPVIILTTIFAVADIYHTSFDLSPLILHPRTVKQNPDMVTSQQKGLIFYQNLGKLFYAIAASDKAVNELEADKLKEMVEQKWKDQDGHEAALQMISVFNWLNRDEEYDAQTCFKEFVLFKNKNESLFSLSMKQLIMETANAIASSFSNKNKSELIMLAKLNIELKKT